MKIDIVLLKMFNKQKGSPQDQDNHQIEITMCLYKYKCPNNVIHSMT